MIQGNILETILKEDARISQTLQRIYDNIVEWNSDKTNWKKMWLNRHYLQDHIQQGVVDKGIVQLVDLKGLGVYSDPKSVNEIGLYTPLGECILQNRYIIPVYDIEGELITLIGWYPDTKKYITLPTRLFFKSMDWYNIHEAYAMSQSKEKGQRVVYVVEGIFDCISLSTLGFPCIAAMGAEISQTKYSWLKLFDKAVVITDNDKTGSNLLSKWEIPIPHVFVKVPRTKIKLTEQVEVTIKDIDDVVKYYPPSEIQAALKQMETLIGKQRVVQL